MCAFRIFNYIFNKKQKLNTKQDGFITMEDFLSTCYNDEVILNSISMLDTVF
jgi:hypothetical protein